MKLTEEEMHELEILTLLGEKDFDHNTCDNSYIDLVMKSGKKAFEIINKQQKEIEKQASLIKFDVKYRNQLEQDLYENASNYVVSKDKIREKIKELENQKVSIKVGFEKIFEAKMNNAKTIDTLRELLRGE